MPIPGIDLMDLTKLPIKVETRSSGGAPHLWLIESGENGGIIIRSDSFVVIVPLGSTDIALRPDQ